jgi:hypothetical protein
MVSTRRELLRGSLTVFACIPLAARLNAQSAPIVFEVVASKKDWQQSPVTLASGKQARIVASGNWGVIDPGKRGDCNPSGYGSKAGKGSAFPGANEGALLVKVAGFTASFPFMPPLAKTDPRISDFPRGVLGFSELTVSTPGVIQFLANDYTSDSRGVGYTDNRGSLTVHIFVS